ncbi:hypothetical protein MMC25_000786 [Agyrium rufum]|nr:hypothetical protein [Agyrium rufum]
MATEKLNRLKMLMQDTDFQWPTEEELLANKLRQSQVNDEPEPPKPETSAPKATEVPPPCSEPPNTAISRVLASLVDGSEPNTETPVRDFTRSKPPFSMNDKDIIGGDDEARKVGQLSSAGRSFCPIHAVAKYPYRFLSQTPTAMELVSQAGFAGGKFWEREWSIYYFYPPSSISENPVFLVPAVEVKSFFDETEEASRVRLGFPAEDVRGQGFRTRFLDDGLPRPRFLGVSKSRLDFDTMGEYMPSPKHKLDGEPILRVEGRDGKSDRSFAAFRIKIELMIQATKKKKAASKDKKRVQRINQKRGWNSQLRRTQRYLGLKPPRDYVSEQWSVPGQSTEEEAAARDEYERAQVAALPELDPLAPVPYPFENDVVFIAIDVEVAERSHKCITEIGVSTLDTRDLKVVPPSERGKAWLPLIRARHFRIKEYAHIVNKDFVNGCPDRFEKEFGESEFISLDEAPKVLAACFRHPFSSRKEEDQVDHTTLPKRNIILVGHAIANDIQYLRDLGYDARNLSSVLEVADTEDLYRAWKSDSQGKGLGSLLVELCLVGWNLHNAVRIRSPLSKSLSSKFDRTLASGTRQTDISVQGNDAAYTMQCLVGIAFAALTPSDPDYEQQERDKLVELAAKEAQLRVRDAHEEWDVANMEEDDDEEGFGWVDLPNGFEGLEGTPKEGGDWGVEIKHGTSAENVPTNRQGGAASKQGNTRLRGGKVEGKGNTHEVIVKQGGESDGMTQAERDIEERDRYELQRLGFDD